MGVFDSITNLFESAVSDVLGTTSGSYLGGSNYASPQQLSVNYPPYQPVSFPVQPEYPTMPVMAMTPAIATIGRMGARFPALWASLTVLSQRFATKITPERLWHMFKTFGPGIAAMIGAEALNELMVYHSTHKRRRMDVANTKALRRSVRRLKGFDRLSHRVSAQLGRVAGKRRTARRCGTCRKNPCSC